MRTLMKSWLMVLAMAGSSVGQPAVRDRLVYTPTNLAVDDNITRLIALMERAHKAGYSGVMLADSKFARLEDLPKHYFENCEKVRAAAEREGLEIVPAVFPVGYSNDLLWHDPNLAEALPVRDAEFVVKDGMGRCRGARVVLPGGDMSDLKKWSWHDDTVVADGGCATVVDPKGKNARLSQKLTLTPHRQYHVSVRIRTENFRGTPEIKALGANPQGEAASLVFSALGVKPTQEWTVHHAVFNTLEHSEVSLYFGCWDGSTGTLSWDDAAIEEVGLLNVVRRAGAPLSVREDTPEGEGSLLAEGTDYEPIVDPRMGHPPALWAGEYEVWHEPPVIGLKKKLADGTRLRVSYHHVVTVNDGQVMICLSEPRTLELLRDQARRMHELWHARAYFMSHDEIRCLNQDEACESRGLSAGQILADNARACVKILKEINPGGRIYVWSDMFDPNHNAKTGNYYLVRGDLRGSWEGLDRDVIVAAWYFDKRKESMEFFAGRGNPVLIAGYYDGPTGQIRPWLDAVPAKADFRGVMYTTWQKKYEELEAFGERAWGK